MNLLTQHPPEAVEIDGQEYQLNTDFRVGLRITLAFEDPQLSKQEKLLILIANLYPVIPKNLKAAIELGLRFLNGGVEPVEEDDPVRLFSFEHDGNLIFSAFQQTHRIDLEKTSLHWWKFLALFMDLGVDTVFCQLVGLRKRIHNGTATKEELKEYHDNKDWIDIPEPDTRTEEEKQAEEEFLRLVNSKE